MAKRGGSAHLKRLAAPIFSPIKRKEAVWLKRQMPGPHSNINSIPVLILVRDILSLADSAKEAKSLITSGNILVDGKPVREEKFPVGIMDVVRIPKMKKSYRVLIDKKRRFHLAEIEEKSSNFKLCRVDRKVTMKGGKMQVGLHDGRTVFADNSYRPGDTVKLSIPEQKVIKVMKLEPNARCLIIKGKHSGEVATVTEFYPGSASRRAEAKLHAGDANFVTVKDYLFVVGDEV